MLPREVVRKLLRVIAKLSVILAQYDAPENLPPPGARVEDATAACPDEDESRRRGTRRERILDVLARAEKPLKGRALARRAQVPYDGNFRELVAGLIGEGLVMHAPRGGYWPAGRRVPAGDDG